MTVSNTTNNSSATSDQEVKAQTLLKNDEVDQAIAIYQSITPETGRILHTMGILYAEKKGDYRSAIKYYERAIELQKQNGEDMSDTFGELGFAHQNIRDFDSAMTYHVQALQLRESMPTVNRKAVASSLLGIANAFWGQQDLSEALIYAQRALLLNRSNGCGDDATTAANLAILANIYHHAGDDSRALESAKQALSIFESSPSCDQASLVTLLNNIGAIQVSVGMLDEAQLTFIRVLNIYEKMLPEGHYTRVTIENNVQQITEMNRLKMRNSFDRFREFLTKALIL